MRFHAVLILRAGISALVLGVAAGSAQVQLPDAPGKDVMVRICGPCHEAQRSASVRLTREGWEEVIAKMVGLGAKGTDEELAQVLDYLAEHFKGDALRPLNLNKATAVELESIAGLLRKEAAALIAHRKKAGPCTSLDDFKKVPGVPFKKITDRRDRLVCF
jgi:competence protein ComEA